MKKEIYTVILSYYGLLAVSGISSVLRTYFFSFGYENANGLHSL